MGKEIDLAWVAWRALLFGLCWIEWWVSDVMDWKGWEDSCMCITISVGEANPYTIRPSSRRSKDKISRRFPVLLLIHHFLSISRRWRSWLWTRRVSSSLFVLTADAELEKPIWIVWKQFWCDDSLEDRRSLSWFCLSELWC